MVMSAILSTSFAQNCPGWAQKECCKRIQNNYSRAKNLCLSMGCNPNQCPSTMSAWNSWGWSGSKQLDPWSSGVDRWGRSRNDGNWWSGNNQWGGGNIQQRSGWESPTFSPTLSPTLTPTSSPTWSSPNNYIRTPAAPRPYYHYPPPPPAPKYAETCCSTPEQVCPAEFPMAKGRQQILYSGPRLVCCLTYRVDYDNGNVYPKSSSYGYGGGGNGYQGGGNNGGYASGGTSYGGGGGYQTQGSYGSSSYGYRSQAQGGYGSSSTSSYKPLSSQYGSGYQSSQYGSGGYQSPAQYGGGYGAPARNHGYNGYGNNYKSSYGNGYGNRKLQTLPQCPIMPSSAPSSQPSSQPSSEPSSQPSSEPSSQPSSQPSSEPSSEPSSQPSSEPSSQPSSQPSSEPSSEPSSQPSSEPSSEPSSQPSSEPSSQPSSQPSSEPSSQPSSQPSSEPSSEPSSQPSSEPSSQPSSQPSSEPSSQPSSQPSSEPSSQPSSQPSYTGFTAGNLNIVRGLANAVYSPDNLYQLVLTGGNTNPGDLRLRYCASGFDVITPSNGCTGADTPIVGWRALTGTGDGAAGGTSAVFQADGNLVVYDGPVPPVVPPSTALWNANTCAACSIGGQGVRLYLPGSDSVCTCKTLLCIVVELSGGGVAYYYAVTNGAFFTNTLTSGCPAAP